MQEGENGDVGYSVQMGDHVTSFSSAHLAASYIADRIENIKKARRCDNLCVVISVFVVYWSLHIDSRLFHSGASHGIPGWSSRGEC